MNNQSLQPEYMARFHCIGAECEDTCCAFWNVTVDKDTYDKYQAVEYPELQKRLNEDVIPKNSAERSNLNYASMRLNSTTGACSFLDHGLCAIQAALGETYLSPTCATYPRRINEIDGSQEVSAALSCPEAARLALLQPDGIEFYYAPRKEEANTQWNARLSSQTAAAPVTLRYFWELRVLAIEIVQNRQYGLSHRLMMLAAFADLVDESISERPDRDLTPLVEQFRAGMASESELTDPQAFPINHSF
jgi:lysine-N-methylase